MTLWFRLLSPPCLVVLSLFTTMAISHSLLLYSRMLSKPRLIKEATLAAAYISHFWVSVTKCWTEARKVDLFSGFSALFHYSGERWWCLWWGDHVTEPLTSLVTWSRRLPHSQIQGIAFKGPPLVIYHLNSMSQRFNNCPSRTAPSVSNQVFVHISLGGAFHGQIMTIFSKLVKLLFTI